MRTSLENIERIEQYLLNELSAEDRVEVEEVLKNDAGFKKQFELQKDIIRVAQRVALKKQIKNATQHTSVWSRVAKWLFGGAIVIGVLVVLFMVNPSETNVVETVVPEVADISVELPLSEKIDSIETAPIVVEVIEDTIRRESIVECEEVEINDEFEEIEAPEKIWSNSIISNVKVKPAISIYDFNGLKTWVKPTEQEFIINPKKGATIEGEQGVLVIVPTNAFLDQNNKVVTEKVTFKMVEALRLEDMVLYNLATTSNGKALETGGMVHFDFSCKGQKVHVNPKRSLYVEIPTDKVKKGMMAFKGEVENGKLNWVDPKPLKKYLVNVDFDLLDFLPTGFDDTVSTLLPYKGHVDRSDAFTDSLYYSLYSSIEQRKNRVKKLFNTDSYQNQISPASSIRILSVQTDNIRIEETPERPISCGLDPISIKSIKTEPFSKTFIATKEFEIRINQLHKSKGSKGDNYLNIYLSNLRMNLSKVDSIVSIQMKGRMALTFKKFAKEGLTNIENLNIYQDQLSNYYNRKRKENKKVQEELQRELDDLNQKELNKLKTTYDLASKSKNLIYSRNGVAFFPLLNKIPKRNVAVGSSYSFQWAASGWANIDAYLHLLDKGSKIVKLGIVNPSETTTVYQWLNMIRTLTPLELSNGKAKAVFPKKGSKGSRSMSSTFCFAIGIKNGKYMWFEKKFNPYHTSDISVLLKPKSIRGIRSVLRNYDSKNNVIKRLESLNKMILTKTRYDAKLNEIKVDWKINQRLRSVAFPCERENVKGKSDLKKIMKYD